MKRFVAAILAILLLLGSVLSMPVMAAEDTDVAGLPGTGEIEPMESEILEIEETENPDDIEVEYTADEIVPDEEISVEDALIPESTDATDESAFVPDVTDSLADETEELLGTAASNGTDAGIATGDYYIVSALSENRMLHVKGKSGANSANIMLYTQNGSDAQRFHVTNYGNGVYGITNIYSKKALTVSAASTAAGANVVQFTDNDMDNKRWYIQKGTKSGFCTIQTRLSANVLSIEGGKAENYANIFVDTNKNTDSQQWKFVKCTVPTPTPTPVSTWKKGEMKTGYYMIQSKLGSSRYLEVASDSLASGGNIQLGPTCSLASRVFYVTNLGSGKFRMQSCISGHYMEVTSNQMAAGTNIRQGTNNSGAKQIFYISTNRDDGYYFIKPSQDIKNYAIAVKGGSTSLGTNIYLTDFNKTYQAQMFKFVSVSAPSVSINEGAYQIHYTNSSSYVASIPAKNNTDGSTATLYKNESNNYQKFNIIPIGSGYYKILVAANQKALTVKGNATGNSADVVQQTYKGLDGQKWKITGCRNRFKLISKLNGKAITTASFNAANNNNLRMFTESSSYNGMQTFGLTKTTVTESTDRGYVYVTDPATKKSFKLEKQYTTDPYVSDTDFLAAVLYTEAGDQGLAGMMMVAYVIKTRMAEGIAAANAGNYVEYPGTLKIMIYQYSQWQVARDGALTRVLTDIAAGEASYLSKARTAASNANAKKNIVLEADATKYVKKTSTTSTQTTLKKGTQIKPADFIYNSFMTPAAWNRYATSGSYPKFASGYGAGKNMLLYKGHVFFLDAEVW